MTSLTPAMKQYLELKEKHRDCILFFRIGDFYEMFFEDAIVASKVLEITLTSRNKGKEDSIPLCGVPHHSASSYIARLIENGFKVAVCEQLEDPSESKGIVKRGVVRVITPGLLIDDDQLPAKENNFLAALSIKGNVTGLAFIDISTGDFRVAESEDVDFFLHELASLEIRELIVSENLRGKALLKKISSGINNCLVNYFPPDYFDEHDAMARLTDTFPADVLSGVEYEKHPALAAAAGAVLRYVAQTQNDSLRHITRIEWHRSGNYLVLDENARRNLELFATIQDGRKTGSLFHTLDETVTPMGGRRLRWWLRYPLVEVEKIRERLSAVFEIKVHHLLREELRKNLSSMADLQRLASRVSMGAANARDLVALKASLQFVPPLRKLLGGLNSPLIRSIFTGLDEMHDVVEFIDRAILDDPLPTLRDGGMIKKGYDEELDNLISITRDGKQWIASMEERERKKTGINSLKIGFNSVFGYYIEVTRANAHLVPDDYVRKQTLVNAERYINPELKGYEETVLNADEKKKEREYRLFLEVRARIAGEIRRIQATASFLADLDALVSLAEAAEKYSYCCPQVDEEERIDIRDGRHPVVERMTISEGFVPNDTYIDCDLQRCLIITGPNMAGKSTYIRQVALIVLMAQMGSFVPASEARIGIVDRIFTRVGASDSLARGQSTFMVEMMEVAEILKQATRKSLILLDEVGRGTSTFDGLSIAWAVAEFIHDSKELSARTLFATHYHQLMDMALTKEGIKNYHVAVREWGEKIIFLRKILEGGTNKSYGIQVAQLAGVPERVILRAKEILENLERGEFDETGMPRIARPKGTERARQEPLSLFISDEDRIIRDISEIDILNMTPLDALNKISEWKEMLKKN
ncbi:MAG: DNA mismatch repair protein MutS [Syntrophales bacterium]